MSDEFEKRTEAIGFTVKPSDRERIERAAAKEGLATGSYVRHLVVMHLQRQAVAA